MVKMMIAALVLATAGFVAMDAPKAEMMKFSGFSVQAVDAPVTVDNVGELSAPKKPVVRTVRIKKSQTTDFVQPSCYTRDLIQGSGTVRICG